MCGPTPAPRRQAKATPTRQLSSPDPPESLHRVPSPMRVSCEPARSIMRPAFPLFHLSSVESSLRIVAAAQSRHLPNRMASSANAPDDSGTPTPRERSDRHLGRCRQGCRRCDRRAALGRRLRSGSRAKEAQGECRNRIPERDLRQSASPRHAAEALIRSPSARPRPIMGPASADLHKNRSDPLDQCY